MRRVFIGYDPRQPISLNVLQHSIYTRASVPVAITPIKLDTIPLNRQGLTPFTFSRFMVPWMCGYKGLALFLDLDMLCLADIEELFQLYDGKSAVMVVKNDKVEFERSSLMLFNCEKNDTLLPDFIERADGLHGISWVPESMVGALPREWNHCVGYDDPRPDAKLVHYTQGVPCFDETRGCEYSDAWFREHKAMNSAQPWATLMGNSVHASHSTGKPMPKLAVGG